MTEIQIQEILYLSDGNTGAIVVMGNLLKNTLVYLVQLLLY
jgi:hypothetical protein